MHNIIHHYLLLCISKLTENIYRYIDVDVDVDIYGARNKFKVKIAKVADYLAAYVFFINLYFLFTAMVCGV